MKNQAKNLAILTIVLLSLVGAYFGLGAYNQRMEDKEAEAAEALEAELTLFETDTDTITAFSYTYEGETYEYVKEDGTWYYSGDRSMNLDLDEITSFLSAFASIQIAEEVGQMTDLEPFGLDEGYVTVSWTTDEGTHELHIGDYNETLSEYYLNVAGESVVYLQASSFQSKFAKTPDYFEEEEVEETTDETAEEATETDAAGEASETEDAVTETAESVETAETTAITE